MDDEELLAGRYRRIRSLGRGASGEVWLAEDLVLHRQVAVKNLRAGTDDSELDRVIREARLTARLNHPNAVAVYDLVVAHGRPHVIMEYVAGQTLAALIAATGGLPADTVAALGAAVADALADAHAMGIVHRDVKPANILVTTRGTPKLADFGIARIAHEAGSTLTGHLVGTPAYLAPEVARGGRADEKSDVWSLGVTLWAALQGHPPAQQRPDEDMITVVSRVAEGRVRTPVRGGPFGDAVMVLLTQHPGARPTARVAAALLRGAAPAGTSPLPVITPTVGEPATASDPGPQAPAGPVSVPPAEDAAAEYPTVPLRYAPPPSETPPSDTPPVDPTPDGWNEGADPPVERRRAAVLFAVLALVAAAVVGAVFWLGGDRTSSADRGGPPSPSVSGSATRSGGSSGATAATQVYQAPGGISLTAPAGWSQQPAETGNSRYVDLVRPGTDREHGVFVRVGISNTRAPATIRRETQGALGFIRSGGVYTDVTVVGTPVFSTFLGHPAVDIEYVGTNAQQVRRHVIERLWIADGQTHIVALNVPDTDWSAQQPLFGTLTRNCRMS